MGDFVKLEAGGVEAEEVWKLKRLGTQGAEMRRGEDCVKLEAKEVWKLKKLGSQGAEIAGALSVGV